RSVAITREHGETREASGRHDVEYAVPGHVADAQFATSAGVLLTPTEGSVSLSEKHADILGRPIAGHSVQVSISIEIAQREVGRLVANGECSRAEHPRALVQQDRTIERFLIGRDDVHVSVAVQVANGKIE